MDFEETWAIPYEPFVSGDEVGVVKGFDDLEDIGAETSSIDPKGAAEPSVLKSNLECMVIDVFIHIKVVKVVKGGFGGSFS